MAFVLFERQIDAHKCSSVYPTGHCPDFFIFKNKMATINLLYIVHQYKGPCLQPVINKYQTLKSKDKTLDSIM